MQPTAEAPRPCPNCGVHILRELLTGDPLNAAPAWAPHKQAIYSWHICGRKPRRSATERAPQLPVANLEPQPEKPQRQNYFPNSMRLSTVKP